MAKSPRALAHPATQSAPAAVILTITPPKAARETPGDRAHRFAFGAETVLQAYAAAETSNWAKALHQLVEDASFDALNAIETGDVESIRAAADRYAMATAIVQKICSEDDDNMLSAGAALMEVTKEMIDAEAARLAKVHRTAASS